MRLRSKLGAGTVVRVKLPRDRNPEGQMSGRGLAAPFRPFSSVGATSRAICTSAAISGVIGSRCGITMPML